MKFTFQTVILLVVVSLIHVAVIAQFLPEPSGSMTQGASVPEGMIGPRETNQAASSQHSNNSELNGGTETEAPDLADLVKDAAASFPEFEGSEGPKGESAASGATDVPSSPLINPEAETVLTRMAPEQPKSATEQEVVVSAEPGSEALSPDLADPVAQVRPQAEPSPSKPKSTAADALKVRLISPLP